MGYYWCFYEEKPKVKRLRPKAGSPFENVMAMNPVFRVKKPSPMLEK